MRVSILAKNMLKYLPVVAVLVATGIGLFLGHGLYPTLLDSPSTTPAQMLKQPDNSKLLAIPEAAGPCGFSGIYTSLPPKCRNLDGTFVPVPGTSPFILMNPEGK